jgi:hypothetical protein
MDSLEETINEIPELELQNEAIIFTPSDDVERSMELYNKSPIVNMIINNVFDGLEIQQSTHAVIGFMWQYRSVEIETSLEKMGFN